MRPHVFHSSGDRIVLGEPDDYASWPDDEKDAWLEEGRRLFASGEWHEHMCDNCRIIVEAEHAAGLHGQD